MNSRQTTAKTKQAPRRNSGSLLVWVSVALLLITILAGAVLSIAMAYAQRSTDNNADRQAYFTARSACNAIGGEICQGTAGGQGLLQKLPVGSKLQVENFDFPQKMGSCTALVERVDIDTIDIAATATVGRRRRTVHLKLNRTAGGRQDSAITGFFGLVGETIEFGSALKTGADTDVYVSGEDRSGWGVQVSGTALDLGGSLYSRPGVTVSGGTYGKHLHVAGSVVSNGPIQLSGYLDIAGSVYSTTSSQCAGGVTVGGTVTPAAGGAAQPSKLPELDTPTVPSCPPDANAVYDSTFFNKTLGVSGQNAHYQIQKDGLQVTINTAEDAGNCFYYIPAGTTFTVAGQERRATNSGTVAPAPNLYFILGENARLVVQGDEFYGYVYGPSSSRVDFTGSATAYGAVQAGTVSFDDLTFYYVPPTGGTSSGGSQGQGEAAGFTGFYAAAATAKKGGLFAGGEGTVQFGRADLNLHFSSTKPLQLEPHFINVGTVMLASDDSALGAVSGDMSIDGDLYLDKVVIGTPEKPVTVTCTGKLVLSGGSVVYGTVVADAVDMTMNGDIVGSVSTVQPLSQADAARVQGSIQAVAAVPFAHPAPARPQVLPIPDDSLVEKLTNKTTEIGHVGRDAYYYLPQGANLNLSSLTVAEDAQRIFIYLLDGAELKLDDLYGGDPEHPQVVFSLGEDAAFIYNNRSGPSEDAEPLCAYIAGGTGSSFTMKQGTDFYGGLYVDSLDIGDWVRLHFTGDITAGGQPVVPPDEDLPTTGDTWSFGMYSGKGVSQNG